MEGRREWLFSFRAPPLLCTLTWSSRTGSPDVGCAEEEGYHCGIPGFVAMATRSRGLGPPLPWLGAAGGPRVWSSAAFRKPPLSVETWAEGPAVSRWALGNPHSGPSPKSLSLKLLSLIPSSSHFVSLLLMFKILTDKVYSYHGHAPRQPLFKNTTRPPPHGFGGPALEDRPWGDDGLICLLCHLVKTTPFTTLQKGKTVFGSTIELRSAKFKFLTTITHVNCIGLLFHVKGRNWSPPMIMNDTGK